MNKLNQDSLYPSHDFNLAPPVCDIKYPFLAYISYFERRGRLMRSICCLPVCTCITPIIARQRLAKHIPAATNTHEIKELLNMPFSMRSVSYQRKMGDSFPQNFLFNLKHGLSYPFLIEKMFLNTKKSSGIKMIPVISMGLILFVRRGR
jgi:hypothetical protein